MSEFTKKERNLVLRSDFYSFMRKAFESQNPGTLFLDNWHLHAIVYYLELCRRGIIKRLLVTISPRSLKSHIASICFPSFLLGHDPSIKILCASYSSVLSEELSNKCRMLMKEDWYKEVFPKTAISPIKDTASEFHTTMHGHRIATSPGGTLTGRGGNFIIIDDANKGSDYQSSTSRESVNRWFDETLQSRLNNSKEDCIIVVQQRIHPEDLAGYLLGKGDWTHLNLSAIAQEDQEIAIGHDKVHHFKKGDLLHEDRFDRATLDRIRKDIGSYIYSAQYLQKPVPEKGNLIPIDKFATYKVAPDRQSGDEVFTSWDLASTQNENSDYSVGTVWLRRLNTLYLLDVMRCKLSFTDLIDEIYKYSVLYKANAVLIENAGIGPAAINTIRNKFSFLNIIPINPIKDKVVRMSPGTADIEAGRVVIPETAPWLDDFIRECSEFPNGKHDDQIDSMSQFLNWIRDRLYKPNGNSAFLEWLDQDSKTPKVRTKDDFKNLIINEITKKGF